MMGKRKTQMQLIMADICILIPENHLLERINDIIDFDFIYEITAPFYSETGRKPIDPVSLVKMLLIGVFIYYKV